MGGLEIKKERKACPIVSRKHCVNNSFNFIHKHLCKILFYAYIQPYIHIHPIHILCTIYIILVNLKMFLVKILPLGSGSGSAKICGSTDPDPGNQNHANPTDPDTDPKHWCRGMDIS